MALSTSLNLSRNHKPDDRSRASTASMCANVSPRTSAPRLRSRTLSATVLQRPATLISREVVHPKAPCPACRDHRDVESTVTRAGVSLSQQMATTDRHRKVPGRADVPPSAAVALPAFVPAKTGSIHSDTAMQTRSADGGPAVVPRVAVVLRRIVSEHRCAPRELRPRGLRCVCPDREADQKRKQDNEGHDRPLGRRFVGVDWSLPSLESPGTERQDLYRRVGLRQMAVKTNAKDLSRCYLQRFLVSRFSDFVKLSMIPTYWTPYQARAPAMS